MFAAGAVRLRVDDDLVLRIHRCDAGIALDDALRSGHLGGFVVGAVGQPHTAFGPFAVFRMLLQPVAQVLGVLLQAFEAARFARGVRLAGGGGIGVAVLGQHRLRRLLHLRGLALEIGARAGLGFAGVTGQLDTVDGEHLAPDQALPIAERQHLGEQLGGQIA